MGGGSEKSSVQQVGTGMEEQGLWAGAQPGQRPRGQLKCVESADPGFWPQVWSARGPDAGETPSGRLGLRLDQEGCWSDRQALSWCHATQEGSSGTTLYPLPVELGSFAAGALGGDRRPSTAPL